MDTDGDIRDAWHQKRIDCINDNLSNNEVRDECLAGVDNDEYQGTEIFTTCTCTRSAEAEREEAVRVCNAEYSDS